MAQYVYEGPGPQEDGEGGLARPGDIREFDAEPDWGPWRLLEESPESDSPPPVTPPVVTPPVTPPAGSPAPPATIPAAPPATDSKGM